MSETGETITEIITEKPQAAETEDDSAPDDCR